MLAHETIAAAEGRPRAAFLFLHGILGRGRNWRSLARSFAEERPEWLAVTVDLRAHGDSLGLAPPHTVAAAAADLGGLALDVPVRGVLGHSFGGKVALAFAEQRREAGRPLLTTWVIDSTPSARPDRRGSEAVSKVLDVLAEMPERFSDRRAFVSAATERGLARPIAQWLAMNLRSRDGGYVYGVEMDVVDAMLEDYFALDQWPVVEAGGVQLVLGGKSPVFDAADRDRAEGLAAAGTCGLHVIEDAGHWVHADAPGELSELLREQVPPAARGDRST
ncbi:MAG: alpha/beta hydrolase [Deltaproteobacteria bacterium]|nr:alpha/beta hydrolase [Deltaproteobacteria bacterium]